MESATMISVKQRQAIFALGRNGNLDNDELHAVVKRVTGRESISQLTTREAIRVIDELKWLLGRTEPLGWLTAPQRGKIFALCRELGWVTDKGGIDMTRLEGFIRARFKIDRLSWVQMDKARGIIEALKAMDREGRGDRRMPG